MTKTWFITGAGSGIGAGTARAALKAGDRVVATGRNLDKVSNALRDLAGESLAVVALDVSSEAQAQAAVDEVVKRFGCIDVVVNNAGYSLLGNFEEMTAADIERQFAPNFYGVVYVMHNAQLTCPETSVRMEGRSMIARHCISLTALAASAFMALLASTASAQSNRATFPANFEKYVLYATYDRGSSKEEAFATPESLAIAKSGQPLPPGTQIVLGIWQDYKLTGLLRDGKRRRLGARLQRGAAHRRLALSAIRPEQAGSAYSHRRALPVMPPRRGEQ